MKNTIVLAVLSLGLIASISYAGCDDLLLYYGFESIESNVVEDLSGNENHGKVYQSVLVPGIFGNALSLENGGWIDAGNIIDLTPDRPVITVVIWVKGEGDAQNDFIIGKQQDFWPYRGWSIGLSEKTRVSLTSIDRINEAEAIDDMDLRDDEWHCVTAVFETAPSLLRTMVYVDGQLRATDDDIGSHSSLATIARLWIGKQYAGYLDGFQGVVDEVRIFGRALSEEEIQMLAESPEMDPCANQEEQRAYWVTRIGFSNDPGGEQDVTEFYPEETLYVTLDDVQLGDQDVDNVFISITPKNSKKSHWNWGWRKTTFLTMEYGEDGLWRASVDLSEFDPGDVDVRVFTYKSEGSQLWRKSVIHLNE